MDFEKLIICCIFALLYVWHNICRRLIDNSQ